MKVAMKLILSVLLVFLISIAQSSDDDDDFSATSQLYVSGDVESSVERLTSTEAAQVEVYKGKGNDKDELSDESENDKQEADDDEMEEDEHYLPQEHNGHGFPPDNPPAPSIVDEALEWLHGSKEKQKNPQKAIALLEERCVMEDIDAMVALAEVYYFGHSDTPIDFAKAFELYNNASQKGSSIAQRMIGIMYEIGRHVHRNPAKAMLFYSFAAKGGDRVAHQIMGYRYAFGHNVQKSCATAVSYYKKAARVVAQEVIESGSHMLEFYDDVSDHWNSFESRTTDDVVEYYEYSAETGDPQAQLMMGNLHLQGDYGIQVDEQRALQYFRAAAEQGNAGAMSRLAYMYAQGKGVPQDNATAVAYYRQAAAKGSSMALTNLGYMYLHGQGVEKDLEAAFECFRKAAEKGQPDAMLNLGTMYYNGWGTKVDIEKAQQCFVAAASKGHILAIYNLASMYLNGIGTSAQCNIALALYKKVAEQGELGEELDDAFDLFKNGDFDRAILRYEALSVTGLKLAQLNTAFLYEQQVQSERIASEEQAERLSLYFYSFASEQMSAGANLKIGDSFYFGTGGLDVDLERAASFYKQVTTTECWRESAHPVKASDMNEAQATWNLGYMQQHGLGLPKDFHIAKRYYDLAAKQSDDAVGPATISLVHLFFHHLYDNYVNPVSNATSSPFIIPALSSFGSLRSHLLNLIAWDTALLILLGFLVLLAVFIRQYLMANSAR